MKKHILTLLLVATCAIGHAQSALFQKYQDNQAVNIVMISKAMFRMMPNIDVGNHNIRKIASKIDNLQVLTCERQALIAKISKDALATYARQPWEEVMRYKEGTGTTIIYMHAMGKGKYEYALYTTERGELQIISITGNITLQDIKSITN